MKRMRQKKIGEGVRERDISGDKEEDEQKKNEEEKEEQRRQQEGEEVEKEGSREGEELKEGEEEVEGRTGGGRRRGSQSPWEHISTDDHTEAVIADPNTFRLVQSHCLEGLIVIMILVIPFQLSICYSFWCVHTFTCI